ncbi:DUF3137 domain-containing protein [Rhizobium sp. TH2]|uniref:DUF3137 domain-containing protein n=1 Tax=Rhizobium sp. TH2 TaxID=2775403 RepID=UPI0021581322|nr:DUF3137 domain-containing protein [Rhizobium sp. TH2]UVC11513.1 DUF3137 domain-containing protein [Rhizobium sp. TH2]
MESMKDPNAYMPGEAAVAEIKRHIDEYNRDRPGVYQSCVNMAWLAMIGYAAAGLFVVYVAYQMDERGKVVGFVLALVGAAGFWLWRLVWQPLRDHQLSLRYRLFPEVFRFIDGCQYSAGMEPGFLDDLKRLKLVTFTSTENDDLISGTHDGMGFELVETKLVTGSGKSREVQFEGLIFHFKLEKEFPGLLVAAKRSSWWQRSIKEMWRTGPIDELLSGNRQLDETHDFRSNNHRDARALIAGPITSVLTWLGNEWHGGEVSIALSHGDGYLMLPSKQNFFALPDMQHNVHYESDVKPLVREMVMLLAVAHVVRRVG